jgi:hypothetical protein
LEKVKQHLPAGQDYEFVSRITIKDETMVMISEVKVMMSEAKSHDERSEDHDERSEG